MDLPRVDAVEAAIEERSAVSQRDVEIFAMRWLSTRLGLSRAQELALWLLACIELSPAVARLAQAFGSELSVQILMELVPQSSTELYELSRSGLLESSNDVRLPMHKRPVRANDRVLQLARGEITLDRELVECCDLVVPPDAVTTIPPSLVCAFTAKPAPVIVAQGADGSGRATLLTSLAARYGLGVLRIRMTDLGPNHARVIRAIGRECALFNVIPLFEDVEQAPLLDDELINLPVLLTATAQSRFGIRRTVVAHQIEVPSIRVREQLWRSALDGCSDQTIAEAATRYSATPGTILAAASAAVARSGEGASVTLEDVHEGLRAHLDESLADLATRVRCTQSWTDLVLPTDQFEQIVELVARVRHRGRVLEEWGFADKVGRGIGLAALLSGPPGTGKTMVAGLIAKELGLDLYQVDLSRIVSKYIGETEKNLARVFDAAETGHAVLLFDEADSLFAKRSEVKSSNDRYANLEVNFLLQRVEQFSGISLLTTNHERSIDEAFRRRLAMHIRFTAPDTDQRADLWRAMIPASAPVDGGLDFRHLAELELTGGYIKNATLRAAYLAANDGSAISMTHLWRAARAEYEAMGKLAFATGA
jgi:ATP-dependent 26S proteasome regulatory subunit